MTNEEIRAVIFEAIEDERQRQIDKGFDPTHDDMMLFGELLEKTVVYLHRTARRPWAADKKDSFPSPSDPDYIGDEVPKRDSVEQNLIAAAALIVAELERRARAEARGECPYA